MVQEVYCKSNNIGLYINHTVFSNLKQESGFPVPIDATQSASAEIE